MTDRKTQRNTKQLTATQAADKIALELGSFEDRVLEKIQAIQAVEKQASKDRIAAIMLRVVDGDRDKVAKVLLALGCELSGFELMPANDPVPVEEPEPSDRATDWLTKEPPPAPKPIVVERGERKTGPGR